VPTYQAVLRRIIGVVDIDGYVGISVISEKKKQMEAEKRCFTKNIISPAVD
jgi:hypothetical protein